MLAVQNNNKARALKLGALCQTKDAIRVRLNVEELDPEEVARSPEFSAAVTVRNAKRCDPVADAIERARRYTLADFHERNPAPYPGELVEAAVRLKAAQPATTDAEVARDLRAHMRDAATARIAEIEKDSTLSAEDRATFVQWGHESLAQYADVPEPGRFEVIEAADFAGAEHVEPEYLVDELLPRRGLGMLWGESGAGKSFLALDLACAITRGVKWRDRHVTKGRAVYIVGEGEHSFDRRLKAYAARHNVPLSELPAIIPAAPNLYLKSETGELIKALKARGAQLVIVDTLSVCALGADENSAKDMGEVIARAKQISRELDALTLLCHHSGKNQDRGARGSSVLRPAVDVELSVTHDGVHGCATVEKLKDGPRGGRFGFALEFEALGMSHKTGKPFGSLVVKHEEAAATGPALPQHAAKLLEIAREALTGRASVPLVELQELARAGFEVYKSNFAREFKKALQKLTSRGDLVAADGAVALRVVEVAVDEFDEQ